MSTQEVAYQDWLTRLKQRVVPAESAVNLNRLLPKVAARLGLQDPFQYIADHDGKGQTLCLLLGALTLAELGWSVAYTSRRQGLAELYAFRAKALVERCETATCDRIVFKNGGIVWFLHPMRRVDGERFNEIIEDD